MRSAYISSVLANLDVTLHQRTPTGEVSVSEDILKGLRDRHPIIPLLLEYRSLVRADWDGKHLREVRSSEHSSYSS